MHLRIITRWDESEWFNPAGDEDTYPEGTTFVLSTTSHLDAGVIPLYNPDEADSRPDFSATRIQIKGSETNLRLDLLGQFYDREASALPNEPVSVGCVLMSSDADLLVTGSESDNSAMSSCNSLCKTNVDFPERQYYGVRRVAPRDYKCHCSRFGLVLGEVSSSFCTNYVTCRDLRDHGEAFFGTRPTLTAFLSASNELRIEGKTETPSLEPNLCNEDRVDDVAAMYLAAVMDKDDANFVNSVFDPDAPFYYRTPGYYKREHKEVTDPTVKAVYRRVYNSIGRAHDLIKWSQISVKNYAYSAYHHCVNHSASVCGNNNTDNCFETFKLFQTAFIDLTNNFWLVDETIPTLCDQSDVLHDNNFFPFNTYKAYVD